MPLDIAVNLLIGLLHIMLFDVGVYKAALDILSKLHVI